MTGPRAVYFEPTIAFESKESNDVKCRAAIRALQQAVETIGHTGYFG